MKVIGLTGGIGSGKSTVSEFLSEKGFKIIDADEMARKMTEKGSQCLNSLVSAFGNNILYDDGSLNRKKLGSVVFADPVKKKKLEELTTQVVTENVKNIIADYRRENTEKIVFLDAPLLFETGADRFTDFVWLVSADEEVRINRVVKRDGTSPAEVKKRINNQMSEKEKILRSSDIIDNSGGKEELYRKVEALLKKYD